MREFVSDSIFAVVVIVSSLAATWGGAFALFLVLDTLIPR